MCPMPHCVGGRTRPPAAEQAQAFLPSNSEYLQLGCGCCINIDLIPSSCELRELCELYCCTCAASILIVSNIFLPDTLQSHLNANVNANKYLQISLSSEFTLSLAFS